MLMANGITAITGPNTSSWAMRMRLFTPVKMVGSTNQPSPHSGREARDPPTATPAPSPLAMSMYFRIFSSCGWLAIGPTWVSALIGSPILASLNMATSLSTKRS